MMASIEATSAGCAAGVDDGVVPDGGVCCAVAACGDQPPNATTPAIRKLRNAIRIMGVPLGSGAAWWVDAAVLSKRPAGVHALPSAPLAAVHSRRGNKRPACPCPSQGPVRGLHGAHTTQGTSCRHLRWPRTSRRSDEQATLESNEEQHAQRQAVPRQRRLCAVGG